MPFCFSGYSVHLRCTSGGGGGGGGGAGGCLVSVCCPAVLLSLLSGLYRVHGLRVSSLCQVARWHFLPPLSFQKVFVCCCCFISLLFHHTSFVFIFGLLVNSYPLLACLIIAAILNFSFRLHLFTSRCYISSVVLISDLLYQSAGPVFLDGGRVSDGLVWLSICLSLA